MATQMSSQGPTPALQRLSATTTPAGSELNSQSTYIHSQTPPSLSNQPPAKMMGPGVSWNPDPTGLPLYPSEETLAAEYRAFLESYQPPITAPLHPQTTQAQPNLNYPYRRDADDAQSTHRNDSSRDSTSPGHYSTASGHANYGSPDPYPHLNATSHNQRLINSPNQHPHARQDTTDRPSMQSPESYTSGESPNAFPGLSYPYQQSTYHSQDQGFYNGSWMDQSLLQHPQISSDFVQPPQQQQHNGHPTPARYARPPASTNPFSSYGSAYQYAPQQPPTGVSPAQVNAGGHHQSSANVGAQVPPQQRNTRPMPGPRQPPNAASLNTALPRPRVPSGGAQQPSAPAPAARVQPIVTTNVNNTRGRPTVARGNKRVRPNDDQDSDFSDDDSDGDAPQTQQQGDTKGSTNRLPGACAPCKRLKMKCVFPEGDRVCQRCRNSGRGHLCVVGPRKPRQPSNKKELLLQKLRDMEGVVKSKDAVIKSLLDQLQNPHVQISLKGAPRLSPSISSGAEAGPHRTSPDERPIDKTILDWVEKAQASILSTAGYRLNDGRGLDESDSSSSPSGSYSKLGSQMSPTKSVSESGRSGRNLLAPDQQQPKSSPKLFSLPLESAPVGLLAEMALKDTKETNEKRARSRSKTRSLSGKEDNDKSTSASKSVGDTGEEGEDDGAAGMASKGYFEPVPQLGLRTIHTERKDILEIMTSGLISPTEVDQLFKIFFDKLNVFVSILDPVLHTPATTFGRSPFLFTVVCAISSRYYTERPELYSIAMHFARRAAASSLIEGTKSIELCQAYILMSVYSMPSRKWEDAREWLYLGLAIRMAIDLNLHVKSTTRPLNEQHERELLNRTRTWFICYNLDRSASAQLGKPASVRSDPIIRSCKAVGKRPAWWKSSPYNDKYDLHLCAYTDLLSSITAEFQERVYWDPRTEMTGLRTDLDLVSVAFEFDDKLQEWNSKTAVSFATHSDSSSSQCAYRVQLLPFYVNYLRLVMLCLGFQQAIQKGNTSRTRDELVKRCLNAGSAVIRTVVNDLAPTDYLRYAPDGHFVFTSFASAFLIKMLRPEHEALLDAEERTQIIELVERLVEVLRSPRIAVDERHTPMLYSRFLNSLLAKYKPEANEPEQAESISTEDTNPDLAGLSTPPPVKRESPPSDGKFYSASGMASRHRPSPSIEISPPAPDPGFMLSGVQPPQTRTVFDPSVDNSLYPTTEDINSHSYDASTVHPASTVVGGSQYGIHDTEMTDEHMLAPMLAVVNPGFWSSMMLPGLSWPATEDPWPMNLDGIDELGQMGLDSQNTHYHQGGGFQS